MSDSTKVRLIGIALGLGGIALLWWKAGWIAAAGVFLAMWGNNISTSSAGAEPK